MKLKYSLYTTQPRTRPAFSLALHYLSPTQLSRHPIPRSSWQSFFAQLICCQVHGALQSRKSGAHLQGQTDTRTLSVRCALSSARHLMSREFLPPPLRQGSFFFLTSIFTFVFIKAEHMQFMHPSVLGIGLISNFMDDCMLG